MFLPLIKRKLLGIVQTTRGITSLVIGLTVFIPSLMRGHTLSESLSWSLPFILAGMGGFALNDYFDLAKDIINKPSRAIPSGRITPTEALCFGASLLILSSVIAILNAPSGGALAIYLVTIIGVVLYNLALRCVAVIKGMIAAVICSMPIFYDLNIFIYEKIYLVFAGATILFIFGRELLMDIIDIPGDRQNGMRTLAVVLGRKKAAMIAFLMELFGIILVLPLVMMRQAFWHVILITMCGGLIVTAFCLWDVKSGRYRRTIILVLLVPALYGIVILGGG